MNRLLRLRSTIGPWFCAVMLACSACEQPADPSAGPEAARSAAASSSAAPIPSTAVWVDSKVNSKEASPSPSAPPVMESSAAQATEDASSPPSASVSPSASISAAVTTSATNPSAARPTSPGAPPDIPARLELLKKLAKQGILPKGEADKLMRVGAAPKVVLLEKGKEPLAELKYELPTDAKETSTLKMEMSMGMNLGGGRQSQMTMPLVELVIAQTTAPKREASGDIAVASVFSSIGVIPAAGADERVTAEFTKGLSSLKGMKITQVVTPKGRIRDAKMELAPGAPAQSAALAEQMQRSLDNVMAPLPDEAVGEGARWVVLMRLNGGADILQWTTYRLKSKKGKVMELEALVSQLVASPELVAQGPDAAIQSFVSGGTGSTTMDLGHLSPDKGNATVSSSMSVANKGSAATIDTNVKLTFLRK